MINNIKNRFNTNLVLIIISFFIIVFTIQIPFNNWGEYIVVSLFALGCLLGKINKNKNIIYLIIAFLILFNGIKILLPKNIIVEKHAIYSVPDRISHFQNPNLPELIDQIGLKILSENNNYFVNIDKPRKWSFSADSFWTKDVYSRKLSNLNFDDRYELNVGQLNESAYYINDSYDLYYPLLFAFEFKKIIADQICWKGLLFFPNINNKYTLKEHKKISCEKIDTININNQIIFGLDIEESSNLSIKLKHNSFGKKILVNIDTISIFFALAFVFVLFRYSFGSLLTLFLSNSFYIIYLFELISKGLPSKFSELIYLQRGNDGLTHFRIGRDILENLYNNNFINALRGDSDIFYFMPGMRYFNSIFMTIFGDTLLGYLLITAVIPFIIAMILRKLTNKNWSIIIFWCFMIIPIFESFGFFQFYYSKLSILGFGESLCYLFLYLSFLIIIPKKEEAFYSKQFKTFFIFGLLCFGVIFLRPNYILQILSFIIILGLFTFYFFDKENDSNEKKFIKFFLIIIGFSPVLLMLLHNWYFGEKIIFLTEASTINENLRASPQIWFSALYELLHLTINYEYWKIIISNLKTWINYYEIWLMLIYVNLWIGIFRKNNNFIYRAICFSLIISHITYLFYAGDHRYTYGLWSMCLMVFFRDFREYYSSKFLNQKFKKFHFKNDFNKYFYNFLDPLK